MFIDTRQFDDGARIHTEICVVGAGAAGITLASEFEKYGITTCLIESGGFKPDAATRDLYRGESIGLPYHFADNCRSRYFGGSSNCWGGWCRPLEEHDFEERAWVPNSGWPFGKSTLDPYYERALDILKIGPNEFTLGFWVNAIARSDVQPIPLDPTRVISSICQLSPPVRFGRAYRDTLRLAARVSVYLHANVTDIDIGTDGVVSSVKVATLTGKSARVSAQIFILAAGGIENARLLLCANKNQPNGIGNENDVVGRYFMDHPRLYTGNVYFRKGWSRSILYDMRYSHHEALVAHGTHVIGQFTLSAEQQAKERLLNARVCFSSAVHARINPQIALALIRLKNRFGSHADSDSSLAEDLLAVAANPIGAVECIATRYFFSQSLHKFSRFQIIAEPQPDPQSRVMLANERDQLGLPRVKIDWRLGPQVERTFNRTIAIIADELMRQDIADVELDPPIQDGDWPDTFEQEGTWHHMGTTRMHSSPKLGVVDKDCLVHGTSNLYIAGSSVFPTAGSNFPTITIIALALRLAEQANKALKSRAAIIVKTQS